MNIVHYHHSTFFISLNDTLLVFDPFKLAPDRLLELLTAKILQPMYDKILIFISHPHFDHLSGQDLQLVLNHIQHSRLDFIYPKSIHKDLLAQLVNLQIVVQESALLNFASENAASEKSSPQMHPTDFENTLKLELADTNLSIKTVPAYNIDKINPSTGQPYHPKEKNWAGFLIDFGNDFEAYVYAKYFAVYQGPFQSDEKSESVKIVVKSVYFAGDSDFTSEMQKLRNFTDLAVLPVSGTYVMTWQEARQAVQAIQPKYAIPMHYGVIVGSDADAKAFVEEH